MKVLGVECDTEWEVTEVVPAQMIRVEGRPQHNGKASLTQSVTAEGSGLRVSFEVDYDPPFGILGEIADNVVFERRNEEQAGQILSLLKEAVRRCLSFVSALAVSTGSTDAPAPPSLSVIPIPHTARRWRATSGA